MTYTNTSAPTDCDIGGMADWLAAEYFPNTCTISRPVADTSDGMGGQSAPAYTDVALLVRCLDEQATRKEQEAVKHITSVSVRSVKFAGGQDVRLKDRIVISGRTLEVIQVTTLLTAELIRPVLAMESI